MITQKLMGGSKPSAGCQPLLDGSTLLVHLYLGAFAVGALVYQSFTNLGLSTLLTASVGIQCFGYTCLRLNISQTKSVAGISGQTLILQAVSYSLRLCSTTWLMGYIPTDETGDWLYQLLDVCALLMALQIIYCVFRSHAKTYQEDDSQSVQMIAFGCTALAAVLHPDLNSRPLFDTLWTTALYIDVIAMMPQLRLMAKTRGKVEALTSHFVGATAISRGCNLLFWYHGYKELAPLDGSFNFAGWAILVAHIVQMLLLCDFLFYYIRACVANGCHPQMQLSDSIEV